MISANGPLVGYNWYMYPKICLPLHVLPPTNGLYVKLTLIDFDTATSMIFSGHSPLSDHDIPPAVERHPLLSELLFDATRVA